MRGIAAGVLTLSLAGAACDNSNQDSSMTTAPTAPQTTETFTGTVAVGGNHFDNFTVALAGEVDVTLTAAGPPSTIWMGLGIGTGGTACTLLPKTERPPRRPARLRNYQGP